MTEIALRGEQRKNNANKVRRRYVGRGALAGMLLGGFSFGVMGLLLGAGDAADTANDARAQLTQLDRCEKAVTRAELQGKKLPFHLVPELVLKACSLQADLSAVSDQLSQAEGAFEDSATVAPGFTVSVQSDLNLQMPSAAVFDSLRADLKGDIPDRGSFNWAMLIAEGTLGLVGGAAIGTVVSASSPSAPKAQSDSHK